MWGNNAKGLYIPWKDIISKYANGDQDEQSKAYVDNPLHISVFPVDSNNKFVYDRGLAIFVQSTTVAADTSGNCSPSVDWCKVRCSKLAYFCLHSCRLKKFSAFLAKSLPPYTPYFNRKRPRHYRAMAKRMRFAATSSQTRVQI